MTVPPGTMLADVLMSSPMFIGDDGQPLASSRAGFELGFDPSEDPELAMVRSHIHVSFYKTNNYCAGT